MTGPGRGARLPPELFDQIVDELEDSLSDLKSCSLVCRDWLPRSRHHLFHSLSIPIEGADLASFTMTPYPLIDQSILNVFNSSSILGNYVRKLTLDFRYSSQLVSTSESWIIELSRGVTQLRQLTLFMFPIYDLSTNMRRLLPDLLGRNTLLEKITIDSCIFEDAQSFWSFLQHAAQLDNLEHLTLIGVILRKMPNQQEVDHVMGQYVLPKKRARLRTLELGQMSVFALLQYLFTNTDALFDLKDLQRIKIRDIGALFFYADFWPVVGPTITYLDFEIGKYVKDDYVRPQLLMFTSLTHLTLSITASRNRIFNVLTVLAHVPLVRTLEQLTIIWPQLNDTWDVFSDVVGCDALDVALAGLQASVKGLQNITLELRCHSTRQESLKDGYETAILARTAQTGILKVKIMEIQGYTMYGEPLFAK
ncbi:hypothetical protein WG66_016006 [Moniliophthora roreri]|uniref:Uncharacterized protein n=1 Tax=Moniliophthora roreri TaxID=221103 RepID=A0A0W0GB81_MONRR|nr:hypothetical protein WG66_016006 [Moniliophthora roreri]